MGRWLLTLLFLAVPFQFVWAGAASYCKHESDSAAAMHFGHHVHQCQGEVGLDSGPEADTAAPGAFHGDCEGCHLGGSVSLPATALLVAVVPRDTVPHCPSHRYKSFVPSGPERPDRLDRTAAVRSGGGVVSGLIQS